jgi:hypothetical protein
LRNKYLFVRLVKSTAVTDRDCHVFIVERDVHPRRLLTDFLADADCAAKFSDDG